MNLKIKRPQWVIFDWEIDKITIPTEIGQITILPNHSPLVSVVSPWIITIRPKDYQSIATFNYIFLDNKISISSGNGMVFVDGANISIVVWQADVSIDKSEEELSKSKLDLEKKVIELKDKWSIEELEKTILDIKKIESDIELIKIKKSS